MSGQEDAEDVRRRRGPSYSPRHPIPTIQKYLHEKEARKERAASGPTDGDVVDEANGNNISRTQQAKDYAQNYLDDQRDKENQKPQSDADHGGQLPHDEDESDGTDDYKDEEPVVDTTQGDRPADTKKHRKGLLKRKDEKAERQVTDPVTHLPVTIHDYTRAALNDVPENAPPMGATTRSATGLENKSKSNKQLQKEYHEMEQGQQSMQALFPPPEYAAVKEQIISINLQALSIALVGVVVVFGLALVLQRVLEQVQITHAPRRRDQAPSWVAVALWAVLVAISLVSTVAFIAGVRKWMSNRIDHMWQDYIWEANRASIRRTAKAHETESVAWLNSLLSSVWPLINPDLFTSLADTLEDVMQASLPSLVQMVAVDDVGQGSESIRNLGIRWLPTGAAARSVSENGKLKDANETKHDNDRTVPGQGDMDDTVEDKDNEQKDEQAGSKKQDKESKDGADAQVAEGMEAEEGDFINVEVAFAYRARSSIKMFKDRAKDMHMYLAFYLPGKIKLPVWVDVRGVVGTVRARLQLTPDPPFFALCTLTFLGQPKVDVSCFPLLKHGLNIMDLPLISNFVQSSVDAAMSQYVAPKSLTLDLKDMITGDDFKKDTAARGILVIHIKRGHDFKAGDPGIPLIKQAGADPYVSVGWAKFGKPMWSTRVLLKEMEPCWEETAYLLVTPEELNVDERLRVQLWDSDRFNSDDDLGRIEIDLKQIMRGHETNNRMQDRVEGFRALKAGEEMPGKLEWSVGYFSKTRIQKCQLEQQTYDPDVRTMEQLEDKVQKVCERKMREALIKEGRHTRDHQELHQQKVQEMKARTDAMIISAPPPEGFPSGIFSIQIHQITGLEFEKRQKTDADKDDDDWDHAEVGEDLPSAYCTVIINHEKVYKTRTKPKNANPFYNAGFERFIPDWQNAEVYVSVCDARVKEDDPLLGLVHLPLGEVFRTRSQVNGFYPLMGGIGYGRVRLSMVWRSVQLRAPPQALGWSCGTLEVMSGVTAVELPDEYKSMKIRFHTDLDYQKMYSNNEGGFASWQSSKKQSLKLPVKRRYQSCLAVEFRKKNIAKDNTGAFAILWLRDIPDEEQTELEIPVFTGADFSRAKANCMERPGECIGSIKLTVMFWSGLGGAHSKWASKDPNMRDVVDVLEVAREELESHETAKQQGIIEDDDAADSSDEEDELPRDEKESVTQNRPAGPDEKSRPDGEPQLEDAADRHVREGPDIHVKNDRGSGDANNSRDGKNDSKDEAGNGSGGGGGKSLTNIFDSAKDYKHHMKSSHRRHRGLMQWKIPRTVQFGVHKAEHATNKITGIFRHHSREPGIETEV